MKIHYAIGCLCIAAIVIAALGMGYNGVLAGAGVSAIVGLLTWQTTKAITTKKVEKKLKGGK